MNGEKGGMNNVTLHTAFDLDRMLSIETDIHFHIRARHKDSYSFDRHWGLLRIPF